LPLGYLLLLKVQAVVVLPPPCPRSTSHCRYIFEPTHHEMLIVEDLTQDMRCGAMPGSAQCCTWAQGGVHDTVCLVLEMEMSSHQCSLLHKQPCSCECHRACARMRCAALLAQHCVGMPHRPLNQNSCPYDLCRDLCRSFKHNPWVLNPPGFRFYAASPLVSTDGGHRYGTL